MKCILFQEREEPTDPKMSSDWSHISASMYKTKKNAVDNWPKAANLLQAVKRKMMTLLVFA